MPPYVYDSHARASAWVFHGKVLILLKRFKFSASSLNTLSLFFAFASHLFSFPSTVRGVQKPGDKSIGTIAFLTGGLCVMTSGVFFAPQSTFIYWLFDTKCERTRYNRSRERFKDLFYYSFLNCHLYVASNCSTSLMFIHLQQLQKNVKIFLTIPLKILLYGNIMLFSDKILLNLNKLTILSSTLWLSIWKKKWSFLFETFKNN